MIKDGRNHTAVYFSAQMFIKFHWITSFFIEFHLFSYAISDIVSMHKCESLTG